MPNRRGPRIKIPEIALFSALLGAAILALTVITVHFSSASPFVIGLVYMAVYGVMQFFLCTIAAKNEAVKNGERTASSLNSLMADVIRSIDPPVTITSADGKLIWANAAALVMCNAERSSEIAGKNFEEVTGVKFSEIIACPPNSDFKLTVGERVFSARTYLMETNDRDYWMTVMTDTTAVYKAEKQNEKDAPVIAYAVLDNLVELAQVLRLPYREAANAAEDILRRWAAELDGFVKEYERDKYLVVFPREKFSECISGNFEVLDRLRTIGLEDGSISLTMSMGVCGTGNSIAEKESRAAAALETALQRGGDQVAVRDENGTVYYGGKTKIRQKRSKVRSRVIADRLIQLVSEAGNVIIMGHKSPDFDSIGACVGLARIAMTFNESVKIVIDRDDPNFKVCTADLCRTAPEFEDIFTDSVSAIDLVRSDTLLIIADANNMKIVESPEIAANVYKTVIIDHHRKTADFENEPEIAYIEPSASSASELVAELLELASIGDQSGNVKLSRPEADLLLAGIMLDTKNFTRSTSGFTFAAALFLREAGASTENVRTFFFEDISGFITEAKLGSEVRLYKGRIAITVCSGEPTAENRISASKTADKLLTLRQVDAAFVLLCSDDTVLVSARSNGKINVQLILEKIGGGGHFDAAGAQVKSESAREVSDKLVTAIDEYLEQNEK